MMEPGGGPSSFSEQDFESEDYLAIEGDELAGGTVLADLEGEKGISGVWVVI